MRSIVERLLTDKSSTNMRCCKRSKGRIIVQTAFNLKNFGAKRGTYSIFHPNQGSLCVICIDTLPLNSRI